MLLVVLFDSVVCNVDDIVVVHVVEIVVTLQSYSNMHETKCGFDARIYANLERASFMMYLHISKDIHLYRNTNRDICYPGGYGCGQTKETDSTCCQKDDHARPPQTTTLET